MKIAQRPDYTFKYNRKLGRHGWLRLTPAYSVKLVSEIIDHIPPESFILDPFSGTATTGLVASERGLSTHCLDINPFLIWFGNGKCRNYSETELRRFEKGIQNSLRKFHYLINEDNWLPDIHNITRWWSENTLKPLAALRQAIADEFGEPGDEDVSALAWIAFCRVIIETSAAAFNHVSMSFHDDVTTYELEQVAYLYETVADAILRSVDKTLSGTACVYSADAREPVSVGDIKYSHVVTSPPYPNRISYIRELRPYMYWTKFLDTARDAGELDWKAIGGTWGVATSRLQKWEPDGVDLPLPLNTVVSEISRLSEKNALLMANYVWKYFHDMHLHFDRLRSNLKKGAQISYVVGNSSFYGVKVHTELLLSDSLRQLGYTNIGNRIVRKRNSKKELYEYCVYATWQEERLYKPSYFTEASGKRTQLALF
ncbi:DNA adenine methylase [Desulfonema ishimotonii]|nr:DNA adenine methylase [Desulfonema ishimotonii]